jgi:perosamine synthetase
LRGYKLAGEDVDFDAREVLEAIKLVLPPNRPLEHHEPYINGKESQYVGQCLAAGVIGYEYVEQFEEALKRRLGVDHCIATNSGTSALHVALLAAGVKPDEEVLVPSLTFAATANAVCYVGAVPNFVDGALAINPYKLARYLERDTKPTEDKRGRINRETGRRISVIIPVHLLGSPADMPRLLEVAKSFGLEVIEDAAEALGSVCGNRHCGTQGLAGIFSFNNNKIITTNGGGAIVTNDEWVAAKCRQLVSTARIPHPWLIEHDAIAYNYPMGNINAAIGIAQLEQLDTFLSQKAHLADIYRGCCAGIRGIEFCHHGVGSNHWLSAILVDSRWTHGRDDILGLLHGDNILARCLFTPLHSLVPYKAFPRDGNLLYAEDSWRRMICLPSSARLAHDLPA